MAMRDGSETTYQCGTPWELALLAARRTSHEAGFQVEVVREKSGDIARWPLVRERRLVVKPADGGRGGRGRVDGDMTVARVDGEGRR